MPEIFETPEARGAERPEPPEPNNQIGELLHRITDDLKTIARGEVEIVRSELQHGVKAASIDAAAAVIGAIVALIGLGMACVAVVVVLGYLIPWLWLNLLIMAVVYIVIGGIIGGVAAKKLKQNVPDLKVPASEGARTLRGIRESLQPS